MSSQLSRIRAAKSQRRQHPEFRIAPPSWDEAQCAWLEQLVASLADIEALASAVRPADAPPAIDESAVASAATHLWRARKKLGSVDEPASKQARQAGRYLRTTSDALADAGIVVQDHDGLAFHPGLALEVLVFEDDPSLRREVVQNTVRPSVYFHGRLIQMGQVIVGIPAKIHDREDHHA